MSFVEPQVRYGNDKLMNVSNVNNVRVMSLLTHVHFECVIENVMFNKNGDVKT
jgi:hypothetical protein